MTPISLGNDIVDLKIEEPPLHSRYISRVFSPLERKYVDNDRSSLWLYWAAKEAAYKVIKRLEPETYFSPVRFEFDRAANSVSYKDFRLQCRYKITSDYAHVICTALPEALNSPGLHSWLEQTDEVCPSTAIRKLALLKISSTLKISKKSLSITPPIDGGRPPLLKINGKISNHVLSFSHHGRFLSFCFLEANEEK